MGKLILVLPANSLHANHMSGDMEQMAQERGGLDVFRKHGIPATVFCQGVDLLVNPWIQKEMSKPGSIEFGCAPFSHTLIPLINDCWRAEMKHMCRGDVPVMFFGEFCIPKGDQFSGSAPYTLVLTSESVMYSSFTDHIPAQASDVIGNFPPEVPAIKFEGVTGILMREEWYKGFLHNFFVFQSIPNDINLEYLMLEIQKIADMPDDHVVVCPLDLEAPYIGSFYGQQIWEILFREVEKQGLQEVFQPLSAHLDYFASKAVPGKRPHRKMMKWTSWEKQVKHTVNLGRINPRDDREEMVKMIATGSDWFAAWGIYLDEKRRGAQTTVNAQKPDGTMTQIPITYNPAVMAVQQVAYESLRDRKPFAEQLKTQFETYYQKDYLFEAVLQMATRLSL